jgi:hypothetical protein
MYKTRDRQVNFDDFNQPLGLELDPENRWIKKSKLIPWDEIEKDYAKLFQARDGNVAKSARLALGALIIQKEYGFSDEETAAMIQEHPYFQYFCGMRGYTKEAPFGPSLMVHFRKRFTPEILSEINEKIIHAACRKAQPSQEKEPPDERDDGSPSSGGLQTDAIGRAPVCVSEEDAPIEEAPPSGTLIVDATCAPSNIKYPTDTDLLERARKQTETIITMLRDPADGKRPRTYARKARREFVNFSRKRNKKGKEIRRMIFKLLGYLKRNLGAIDKYENHEEKLPEKWRKRLEVIRKVFEQQLHMYPTKQRSVPERIVSLSQPYIRPIVRGKAKSPVEFGAKLDVSVEKGFVRLEKVSFEAYNESEALEQEIERYRARNGFYPARVLADKIYRNRSNLKYCHERGIRLSGPALGRRPKDFVPDKKAEYRDMCERIEVERAFSLAKRRYGLGMIYTKLQETTLGAIALSIMVLNLNKVYFCALFLIQLYFRTAREKFTRS